MLYFKYSLTHLNLTDLSLLVLSSINSVLKNSTCSSHPATTEMSGFLAATHIALEMALASQPAAEFLELL